MAAKSQTLFPSEVILQWIKLLNIPALVVADTRLSSGGRQTINIIQQTNNKYIWIDSMLESCMLWENLNRAHSRGELEWLGRSAVLNGGGRSCYPGERLTDGRKGGGGCAGVWGKSF